jgi:hypothetical protein
VTPVLLSDDPHVLAHHEARSFQKAKLVIAEPTQSAAVPEETITARFFELALRKLASLRPPFLLWIHAMGFARTWDCPLEMRQALVDESDPELPPVLAPPADYGSRLDPDTAWGLRVTYGAQLNLLDACLHVFLQQLHHACRAHDTLTIVTAPRAYPLGEHHGVGNATPLLHGEQLHVPLLVRGLSADLQPQRTQAICQPACVFGTIDDWLSLGASRGGSGAFALRDDVDASAAYWQRGVAWTAAETICGLRTPAWFYRFEQNSASQHRLYAKPDDRWEFNEVADRAADVVAAASAELDRFRESAGADQLDQLPPLPALLTAPWR